MSNTPRTEANTFKIEAGPFREPQDVVNVESSRVLEIENQRMRLTLEELKRTIDKQESYWMVDWREKYLEKINEVLNE